MVRGDFGRILGGSREQRAEGHGNILREYWKNKLEPNSYSKVSD